jgi:hypothetical protein
MLSITKNLAAMGARLAACRLAGYGNCAPRTQSAARARPHYLAGQEKNLLEFCSFNLKLCG